MWLDKLKKIGDECGNKDWLPYKLTAGSYRYLAIPHFVYDALSYDRVKTKRPKKMKFYCEWHPELFGIDEDKMPFADDYEESQFDVDWDELEEKAAALTLSELNNMRQGPRKPLDDDELRDEWKKEQACKYGKKERVKPVYKNDNNERFNCSCGVDYRYSRTFIPHFGDGSLKEGEKLRTPHFISFWESYKEHDDYEEMEAISSAFAEIVEEPKIEKGVNYRPTPVFAGLGRGKLKEFRKRLLGRFRPLTCREIRRYRIPYADALYLELQEDNFVDSAAFFKYLIIKDYFSHQSPDNPGPCLRNYKNMMNIVLEFLKLSEKFSRNGEYHKEALVLLRGGLYIRDHDQKWWWLAEEFYRKAVKASENSVRDGGKSEAVANYILGTFLLDSVQKVQPAQEHLLRALELSKGQDWSAKNIIQKNQDTIHKECANYLCRALIAASKELRKNGKPEDALPLINRSHKLCEESKTERWDIKLETYFELGMTYQDLGFLDWAKVAFKKFIELAKGTDFPKSICDGYLESAICYKSEGDLERCHRHLYSYLLTAKTYQNTNLIAFGSRYLGEFHLHNGHPSVACEFFKLAFGSFLEQYIKCSNVPFENWEPEHFTLGNDVELTRALVGMAEGEKLIVPFCNAISRARNQHGLLSLIKWKNTYKVDFLSGREETDQVDEDVPSLNDDANEGHKSVRFSGITATPVCRIDTRTLS